MLQGFCWYRGCERRQEKPYALVWVRPRAVSRKARRRGKGWGGGGGGEEGPMAQVYLHGVGLQQQFTLLKLVGVHCLSPLHGLQILPVCDHHVHAQGNGKQLGKLHAFSVIMAEAF